MSSSIEREMEAHGTALDEGKTRVRCHYCGKEVGGFITLKHHLRGVWLSGVTPCTRVPIQIRLSLNQATAERHELSLKRSLPPESSDGRRCQPRPIHQASPGITFNGETDMPFVENRSYGVSVDYATISPPWLLSGEHQIQNYCTQPQLVDSNRPSEPFREESRHGISYATLLESLSNITSEAFREESGHEAREATLLESRSNGPSEAFREESSHARHASVFESRTNEPSEAFREDSRYALRYETGFGFRSNGASEAFREELSHTTVLESLPNEASEAFREDSSHDPRCTNVSGFRSNGPSEAFMEERSHAPSHTTVLESLSNRPSELFSEESSHEPRHATTLESLSNRSSESFDEESSHAPGHRAVLESPSNRTSEALRGESSNAPLQRAVLESHSVENISGRCTDQATVALGKQVATSPAARCIGRFFFEAGIDPAMARLPSFREMIDSIAVGGGGRDDVVVPICDDLNGWILGNELKEVGEYVEGIKSSWSQTGCSILLDSWKDLRGRSFINFLVDCPRGTLFWKSADVSSIVGDADTLFMLVDMIIEEVGPEHVVQVISDDGSDTMEDVGDRVMKKYWPIFWTLCADHCINAILQNIEMIPSIGRMLDQAKAVTRFLYSERSAMDLIRRRMSGRDLVETSKLKSVASFLSLHNLVYERENVVSVFASLPSTSTETKARRDATKVVEDAAFWSAADEALKLSEPLVGILHLLCGEGCRAMGILYEAFDQAKEAIRENMGFERRRYQIIWDLVDKIWSGDLHSPLHAFGYHLNPAFFYDVDFHSDAEVTEGVTYTISRMSENERHQDLLKAQLDIYERAGDGFGDDDAIDQRNKISPDQWWSQYADHCPELQRVAVRVLSQRCSGSPKYRLRRGATEHFHEDNRNAIEHGRLHDVEFVYNNRCLQRRPSNNEPEGVYVDETVDPFSDWVV